MAGKRSSSGWGTDGGGRIPGMLYRTGCFITRQSLQNVDFAVWLQECQ